MLYVFVNSNCIIEIIFTFVSTDSFYENLAKEIIFFHSILESTNNAHRKRLKCFCLVIFPVSEKS